METLGNFFVLCLVDDAKAMELEGDVSKAQSSSATSAKSSTACIKSISLVCLPLLRDLGFFSSISSGNCIFTCKIFLWYFIIFRTLPGLDNHNSDCLSTLWPREIALITFWHYTHAKNVSACAFCEIWNTPKQNLFLFIGSEKWRATRRGNGRACDSWRT